MTAVDAGIGFEPLIRLGAFFGVFLAVASWELFARRRRAASQSPDPAVLTRLPHARVR